MPSRAATFLRQDVTRSVDWEAAVNAAEAFGGLHGMVNNTGIYQPKRLMDTDTESFERHMRVNRQVRSPTLHFSRRGSQCGLR